MAFLRRFFVEAKSFELSVGEGASVLRLEEKRKGLSNVLCLGLLGVGWLASTVENLVAELGSKVFAKSFREGPKKFIAQRNSNSFGRFLEVVMYLEGGRRSRIVIPEGRKGFGWRRFADELSKVKVVLEDLMGSVAGRMESPWFAPLTKGKRWGLEADAVPSFAEVVRTVVPSTDKKRPEMCLG
jgi:hypothetical protein